MITKLFAVLCCLGSVAAYSQDEVVITAKLDQSPNDSTVVLLEPYSGESVSSVVKDHQFKITAPMTKGGSVYILQIGSSPELGGTIMYLEKGKVNITGKGYGFKDATYTGDSWVKEWQEIMQYMSPAKEENKQLALLEEKYQKAVQLGDEDAAEGYGKQLNEKSKKQQEFFKKWILAHPNSGVTGYLITVFFNKDAKEMESLYAGLGEHAKNSRILQRWKNPGKVDPPPVSLSASEGGAAPKQPGHVGPGDVAPAFNIPDANGKMVSLDDFKGKYVFLDFWASWCAPCQPQIPFLKAANEKFKDKNFVMVGISLDSKKEAWIKAMEKHQLNWTNVSSLQGWQDAAATAYGATYIPTNVLIGPDGKIVARDLYDDKLDKTLAEIIK